MIRLSNEKMNTVWSVLDAYERASDEAAKANVTLHARKVQLENTVLAAIDAEPPSAESDPIEILCGDRLIRLGAFDIRPAVSVEVVEVAQ